MGIELIIGGLFILAVLVWAASMPSYVEEEVKEAAPLFQPPPVQEEEQVSPQANLTIPQKYRRWQQNLVGREGKLHERESYHTFKERELFLHEQGISIFQSEVELNDLANNIRLDRRLGEIEGKARQVDFEAQKVSLQEMIADINYGNRLNELKQKEIKIDGQRIEIEQLVTQLERRENLLELGQKQLEIDGKEVRLKDLLIELGYQDKKLELREGNMALDQRANLLEIREEEADIQQRENLLDLREQRITIDGKKTELGELKLKLEKKEGLLELKEKEIKIDGKKVELQDLFNRIIHESRKVELDKRELLQLKRDIELDYQQKAFQLQKITQAIQLMIAQFELDKKAFDIQKREAALSLYHEKLNLLGAQIKQMYEIRMKWLEIESKSNVLEFREQSLHLQSWEDNLANREQKLDIRDQQTRLQSLYEATQSKLRELRLDRISNDLNWERKQLQSKWRSIADIQALWSAARRLK
ncbi:MAG: hypothetical protein AAF806_06475 [Bacteroidota bacterium]